MVFLAKQLYTTLCIIISVKKNSTDEAGWVVFSGHNTLMLGFLGCTISRLSLVLTITSFIPEIFSARE